MFSLRGISLSSTNFIIMQWLHMCTLLANNFVYKAHSSSASSSSSSLSSPNTSSAGLIIYCKQLINEFVQIWTAFGLASCPWLACWQREWRRTVSLTASLPVTRMSFLLWYLIISIRCFSPWTKNRDRGGVKGCSTCLPIICSWLDSLCSGQASWGFLLLFATFSLENSAFCHVLIRGIWHCFV